MVLQQEIDIWEITFFVVMLIMKKLVDMILTQFKTKLVKNSVQFFRFAQHKFSSGIDSSEKIEEK